MGHRIKKWIMGLCLLAALVPAAVWAAVRLPHVRAEAPACVGQGESFTVELRCRALQVGSFTGGLEFDSAQLEVTEITLGDAPIFTDAVSGVSTVAEANAAGKIGLYAIHDAQGGYGEGLLLQLTFRAKAPGRAVLTPYESCDGTETWAGSFGRTEVLVSDTGEAAVLRFRLTHGDCGLTLKQGEDVIWQQEGALLGDHAIPVPAGSYTLEVAREGFYTRAYVLDTADTEPPEVRAAPWGDVNGDGETDARDLQKLYEYLSCGDSGSDLDSRAFALVADCNGDGEINILDYQALYEQLLRGIPAVVAVPRLLLTLPAPDTPVPPETETPDTPVPPEAAPEAPDAPDTPVPPETEAPETETPETAAQAPEPLPAEE